MKIPSTQKLVVEDFPEQKDWIPRLFYVVNTFITSVISSINGGIAFGENITGQEYLFDFRFTSNAITFPQLVKWKFAARPVALSVVSALENGEPVIFLCSWSYTADGNISLDSGVKITAVPAVAALAAASRYQIRVRVTP